MKNKKAHKATRKALNQFYITAAPLLLAIAITVAWFTIETTTSFMPMSFASAGTGTPDLFKAASVDRVSMSTENPATDAVTDKVIWENVPIPVESAVITVKNMTPGQTAFYKLKLPSTGGVRIDSITYLDETGKESNIKDIGKYIAVYAVPIGDSAGVGTAVSVTNPLPRETPVPPETNAKLVSSLHNFEIKLGANQSTTLASGGTSFAIAIFYDFNDFGVYDKGTIPGAVSVKLSAVYSGKAQ